MKEWISIYVGAEWIKDPADTSWWIGATILDGTTGNTLSGIGLQSNSQGLQADWVKLTSTSSGSILYMDEFSVTPGNCTTNYNGPFLCGKQAVDSTISLNMSNCADTSLLAIEGYLWELYRQQQKGEFEKNYIRKCLDAGKLESFTVSRPLSEYHYTLSYYDQAGNLVKTVPPEGVHPNRRPSWLDSVGVFRAQGKLLRPEHTIQSNYRFNSLNQVVSQHTPDGGLTRFWYDRLGRLVVRQNAQQAIDGNYSYTIYDEIGRIIEVGQKRQTVAMDDVLSRNRAGLIGWLSKAYKIDNDSIIAEQVISTIYDQRDNLVGSIAPGYFLNAAFQKSYTLRNRLSYTRYYDKLIVNNGVKQVSVYNNSTTYSYDIHGNVDTLLHRYRTSVMSAHGNNQFKAITYKYDLISGRVLQMHYQPEMPDQFYHRYEYDSENKLINAYTSDHRQLIGLPTLEEHDARYEYYRHGPLSRIVLGHQEVQGVDYAYTLQGWVKGVNSDSLVDMDGRTGISTAKDVYRYSLNYFTGEYNPIGSTVQSIFPGHTGLMDLHSDDYRPLYNGNVSSMVVGIPKIGETKLYNYGYDQVSRLVKMDTWRGFNSATRSWNSKLDKTYDYSERISYDGNGNIKTLDRHGWGNDLSMDSLVYAYNLDGNGSLINNRLRYVKDNIVSDNYHEDITTQFDNNYGYDAIGNLTKDSSEGIKEIIWTVFGKIKSVTKHDGTILKYEYDVAGTRIGKSLISNGITSTDWYVRDAQGNVMAIYKESNNTLTLEELHLYGSTRLGILNRGKNMDIIVAEYSNNFNFTRGNKIFELSNHLGNVMVAITDRKIIHDDGTGTTD